MDVINECQVWGNASHDGFVESFSFFKTFFFKSIDEVLASHFLSNEESQFGIYWFKVASPIVIN